MLNVKPSLNLNWRHLPSDFPSCGSSTKEGSVWNTRGPKEKIQIEIMPMVEEFEVKGKRIIYWT